MNDSKFMGQIGSPEVLAQWEGLVIHEPGVLFEERHTGQPLEEASAAELAEWLAVTVLSGQIGHPAHEAIKAKVLGVLGACRERFGQVKIDEVKQQVYQKMQRHHLKRKLTDEELHKRIELLFDEIPA